MRSLLIILFFNSSLCYSQRVVAYWENGNKKSDGRFEDGVKVGLWREWDSYGNLMTKGKYLNGLKEGRWQDFIPYNVTYDSVIYPNYFNEFKGQVLYGEGEYKNGLKQGEWKCYDAGLPVSLRNYLNDTLNGQYIQFNFIDTYVVINGNFDNGLKTGEWTFFNTNGSPDPLAQFVNWDITKSISIDFAGSTLVKGSFNDDKRVSTWNYFSLSIKENNYGQAHIDILNNSSVSKFINDVKKMVFEYDLMSDTNSIERKSIYWSIGILEIDDGIFNGNFKFETGRLNKYATSGQEKIEKVSGAYKSGNLDSILTYEYLDTYKDYSNSKISNNIRITKTPYIKNKKWGWSSQYSGSNIDSLKQTQRYLFRNDSILEKHDYNCVDWSGKGHHLFVRYNQGIPVQTMMLDSLNRPSETILNYKFYRTSILTERASYDNNGINQYLQVYNVFIPLGEVYELDANRDTVFKYIFIDSVAEIPQLIQLSPYYQGYPRSCYIYPNVNTFTDIGYPFKICKSLENPFREDYLDFGNGELKPGYYRYWRDSYLAGEYYTTYLNGRIYYYKRVWSEGDGYYLITVSLDYSTHKSNVIKINNKIYTDSGIYLFTLDTNKNH